MNIPQELIDLTLKHSDTEKGMGQTELSWLRIARSDRPTQPLHRVYTPSLCLIVQGAKDSIVGGKTYHYGPGQYLVNSIAVPVVGQITKATPQFPYLCLVLEIDPALVYEIVSQTDEPPSTKAASKSAVFLERTNPDLTDAMLRLVRTLKSKSEMQILAPLLMREIIFRLLNSSHGPAVRQTGTVGSQIQRINEAIELIRKNFAKNLRMNDLAKAAKMSTSTFHQHFKEVTRMSPLQYQKQIRLHEARRLLLAEIPDAANAGFRVGYESPSQFNREYTRMFGMPPLRDMKRMRST